MLKNLLDLIDPDGTYNILDATLTEVSETVFSQHDSTNIEKQPCGGNEGEE